MTISKHDDMIDSRTVIARIEELKVGLEDAVLTDDDDGWVQVIAGVVYDVNEEVEELKALRAFAEEAENCCDWENGATLIRDSYFERYAEDFASDIGAISSEHQWPLHCIDWEKAARDLQVDYSAVDFDGVTFWVN